MTLVAITQSPDDYAALRQIAADNGWKLSIVASSAEAIALLVEEYVREMRERDVDDSYELLTTREREILRVFAEGKAPKEVASLLSLSLYTVETHRSNIFQKLNLHSGAELILYAVRKGVIRSSQLIPIFFCIASKETPFVSG